MALENRQQNSHILKASRHAEMAYFLGPTELLDLNNLGYYFLANGDIEKAGKLIGEAIELLEKLDLKEGPETDRANAALILYNAGLIKLTLNKREEALEILTRALELSESLNQEYRKMAALLEPVVKNDRVRLVEMLNRPDLHTFLTRARELITGEGPSTQH